MDAWRRLHPSWEYRLWTDADLPSFTLAERISQATSYAQKCDLLRIEVVFRYGGIYADADVEPLRTFDQLTEQYQAFIGQSSSRLGLANALFGAVHGHPWVARLFENIGLRASLNGAIVQQTGPMAYGRIPIRNVAVLPRKWFAPYEWFEEDPGVYPEGTWAVHHFEKSWCKK